MPSTSDFDPLKTASTDIFEIARGWRDGRREIPPSTEVSPAYLWAWRQAQRPDGRIRSVPGDHPHALRRVRPSVRATRSTPVVQPEDANRNWKWETSS